MNIVMFLGPDLLGSDSRVFQHISQVESNLRTSNINS